MWRVQTRFHPARRNCHVALLGQNGFFDVCQLPASQHHGLKAADPSLRGLSHRNQCRPHLQQVSCAHVLLRDALLRRTRQRHRRPRLTVLRGSILLHQQVGRRGSQRVEYQRVSRARRRRAAGPQSFLPLRRGRLVPARVADGGAVGDGRRCCWAGGGINVLTPTDLSERTLEVELTATQHRAQAPKASCSDGYDITSHDQT